MKAFTLTLLLLTAALALQAQSYDRQFLAADQSLMVMPTAYTMPKGGHTFTDYELVVLQYAYGATDRTHLSAGMVFPFTADMFKTFTLGAKQNWYRGDLVQSAALLSYNIELKGGMFGNVVSVGNDKVSGHGALMWLFDFEDVSSAAGVMLGGIVKLSDRVSLISELLSTTQFMDEEGNGVFTLGVRFRGQKMSWDIGGFRLLSEMEGVYMLPLLKATVLF